MTETKVIRITEEAHAMLEQLAWTSKPPTTLSAMATYIIEQAWTAAVSQPNPDVTIEQAKAVTK